MEAKHRKDCGKRDSISKSQGRPKDTALMPKENQKPIKGSGVQNIKLITERAVSLQTFQTTSISLR